MQNGKGNKTIKNGDRPARRSDRGCCGRKRSLAQCCAGVSLYSDYSDPWYFRRELAFDAAVMVAAVFGTGYLLAVTLMVLAKYMV